jgi:ketosteroid isomerase-like protein
MTPAEETVQRFYECLKGNDPAGAAECYCDDATFEDIAFDLQGKANIAAMWRFECSSGLKIQYRDIRTEGPAVKGHWTCDYKFHGVNDVHNEIDSTFTFRDGKILAHRDDASRWGWAKLALGIPWAVLVTAFPFLLRMKAKKELAAFRAKEPPGSGVR